MSFSDEAQRTRELPSAEISDPLRGVGRRHASGDVTCDSCGCECVWEKCCAGCEDGYFDGYEEDPLWYDEGDLVPCNECGGCGGSYWCINKECKTSEIIKIREATPVSACATPNVSGASKEKEKKENLAALKLKMERREEDFHRIPLECDLDTVECQRRIKRMVEARLRYQIALEELPKGGSTDAVESATRQGQASVPHDHRFLSHKGLCDICGKTVAQLIAAVEENEKWAIPAFSLLRAALTPSGESARASSALGEAEISSISSLTKSEGT